MSKLIAFVALGLFFMAAVVVVAALGTIPVYFLWNWLVPGLFGLPALTFLQAFQLNILCGLLFKSSVPSSSK